MISGGVRDGVKTPEQIASILSYVGVVRCGRVQKVEGAFNRSLPVLQRAGVHGDPRPNNKNKKDEKSARKCLECKPLSFHHFLCRKYARKEDLEGEWNGVLKIIVDHLEGAGGPARTSAHTFRM